MSKHENGREEPGVFYWSDLHENHLKRKADRMMLDDSGRTELVESLLRDESPRSVVASYKIRRVTFDENFIKYKVLKSLSTLEWYEIRGILKSLAEEMRSSNATQELIKRLLVPPKGGVTDTTDDITSEASQDGDEQIVEGGDKPNTKNKAE
jgi:hypothetical protein